MNLKLSWIRLCVIVFYSISFFISHIDFFSIIEWYAQTTDQFKWIFEWISFRNSIFFYIMFQYYFVTMDDDKMRGNEKMEKKKNWSEFYRDTCYEMKFLEFLRQHILYEFCPQNTWIDFWNHFYTKIPRNTDTNKKHQVNFFPETWECEPTNQQRQN